jgi:hypothetical protein
LASSAAILSTVWRVVRGDLKYNHRGSDQLSKTYNTTIPPETWHLGPPACQKGYGQHETFIFQKSPYWTFEFNLRHFRI